MTFYGIFHLTICEITTYVYAKMFFYGFGGKRADAPVAHEVSELFWRWVYSLLPEVSYQQAREYGQSSYKGYSLI